VDRITTDLLANGSIMKGQVDRLLAKGISENLILRDITLSGFMTMDRLVRFIVQKIREGEYDLSIIDNYDYIGRMLSIMMSNPIKWLQRRLSKDTQPGKIYETISDKKSAEFDHRTYHSEKNHDHARSHYEISQELSWYDWGKNWWTWIKNKNDSLYDYWFPMEKRVLDIPHPRDRYKVEIQKEQRLKQQQRERDRE